MLQGLCVNTSALGIKQHNLHQGEKWVSEELTRTLVVKLKFKLRSKGPQSCLSSNHTLLPPTPPPQLCFFPPRRLELGQWKPSQPVSDLDPDTQQEARTCLRTNAVIGVLLNCLRHDEPLTSRRMGYWLSHVLCIHLQSQSPEEAFLSDVLSLHLVPDGIFSETWRGWAFSKCLIARTDSCFGSRHNKVQEKNTSRSHLSVICNFNLLVCRTFYICCCCCFSLFLA